MLANIFVDEARLSANEYSKSKIEDESLISNYDPYITTSVVEDDTVST